MNKRFILSVWFMCVWRVSTIFVIVGMGFLVTRSEVTAGFWFWDDDDDPEVRSSVRVPGKLSEFDAVGLAKITLGEATAKAEAEGNGRAVGAKLMEDDGFLFYRVALVMPDRGIVEVAVDPQTGEVLLAEWDDDDHDDDDDEEEEDDDGEDEAGEEDDD
jgi:hypothetical protein